MLSTVTQIIFLLSAVGLAVIILLQQSKNSGMGALAGGASSSVFGARGAGDFLYKTTRFLALVFFISALALSYSLNKAAHGDTVLDRAPSAIEKSPAGLDVPHASKDNTSPAINTNIPSASP